MRSWAAWAERAMKPGGPGWWDGGLGGLGRPAGQGRGGQAGWAESEEGIKRFFRMKIKFLNLARLWKIVEEYLGGILT